MRTGLMMVVCMVVAGGLLAGCGASAEQMTLIANDAAAYVMETLPVYVAANPGDANQAGANATKMLADISDGVTQAKTGFTPEQAKAAADTVLAIIKEFMPLVPAIIAIFGHPQQPAALARAAGPTQSQLAEYIAALQARLAASRK